MGDVLGQFSSNLVDLKGIVIPGIFFVLILIAGYYLLTNVQYNKEKSIYTNYTTLFFVFVTFFSIIFGTLLRDLSAEILFSIWDKPDPISLFEDQNDENIKQFFIDQQEVTLIESNAKNNRLSFDKCKEKLISELKDDSYIERIIDVEAKINFTMGIILPLILAIVILGVYIFRIKRNINANTLKISKRYLLIISWITMGLLIIFLILDIYSFKKAVHVTEPNVIYNAFYQFYKKENPQNISSRNIDYTEYVNPFIGSTNGGNTFPGSSLPLGMVKLGPDCWNKSDNSGYNSNGVICGFSHVHVSGTGGGPKYGNILVMPQFGNYDIDSFYMARSKEYAEVGYYSVTLNKIDSNNELINTIDVELTSTHSVGFHKYTFPKAERNDIIVDVSSFLGKNHCCDEAQKLDNSGINIITNTEISGYSTISGGWNIGKPYTVFFYCKFDKPFNKYDIWKNHRKIANDVLISESSKNKWNEPIKKNQGVNEIKGVLKFANHTNQDQTIQMKVGISFLSIKKAKENLNEVLHWDIDEVKYRAKLEWNNILNRIKIETNNLVLKRNFYTGIYRSYLMPVNRTGEYDKIKGVYFDDYYAIWDTYRTTDPLRILITPDIQSKILNSLLNIYKHEKYAPDARSGNYNGRTQGGSNSDILFTEAYLKNLGDSINYKKAFKSMIKNAIIESYNSKKEGREATKFYSDNGYIPSNIERSGTRTLEYSLCDWAIAVLADSLGKNEKHDYYKRAMNWKNLWRDTTIDGFCGFIWPKDVYGKWAKYKEPIINTRGTWPDFLYEGTTWEYSFFVPHDVGGLISACCGKAKFKTRLDYLFDNDLFNVKNEPSFLTPMLYIWAEDHSSTAYRVNKIMKKHYHATSDGLPGNDDAGAMSAWYVFNAMGIYPNAGSDIYLITTPSIEQTSIFLSNGNEFIIKAENLSNENIYIQWAYLNDTILLDRAWIRHKEIIDGGKLHLIMGSVKDQWKIVNLPPSQSDKQK